MRNTKRTLSAPLIIHDKEALNLNFTNLAGKKTTLKGELKGKSELYIYHSGEIIIITSKPLNSEQCKLILKMP